MPSPDNIHVNIGSHSSNHSEDDSVRPLKRKRVALACSTCRERKVKCDGAKPVCTPCAKRSALAANCVYTVLSNSAKQMSEHDYISSLQQRIRSLQEQEPVSGDASGATPLDASHRDLPSSAISQVDVAAAPQQNAPLRAEARTPGQVSLTDYGGEVTTTDNPGVHTFHEPCVRAGSHTLGAESFPNHEEAPSTGAYSTANGLETNPISAMGATMVGQDRRGARRGNEYYGASSLVSLIRGVAQPSFFGGSQNGNYLGSGMSQPQMRVGTGGANTDSSVLSMLRPQYSLPPRKLADELLALYFDNVHIFYPWTHSQSFRKQYELLWDSSRLPLPDEASIDVGLGGNNCPVNIFVCALNAMFALGCQFSEYPSADKDSASAMFCERVSGLLQFDLLDNGSIACVQALLLSGQYLQCTNFPERCWNIIGLAYRMAVGLGLQSATPPDDASSLEIAMRWQVWHACVQMDITVCMTLGRPSTLRIAEDVPIPSALDEEYLPLADTPPFSDPATSTFFVQNSRAARLLGRILDQIYHPSLSIHSQAESQPTQLLRSETLSTILTLHSELEDFASSNPITLYGNENGGSRTNSVLQRQRNVLHSRLLHMRVLLHRPCFTNFCALARSQTKRAQSGEDAASQDPLSRDGLRASMVQQCALVCVKTTFELIESLKAATIGRATGAWWYNLFYTITCAVIIILTEYTPQLVQHLAARELDAAWRGCLEILGHMSSGHSLAGQYLHSLTALRQRSQTMLGKPLQSQEIRDVRAGHPSQGNVPASDAFENPPNLQNMAQPGGYMPGEEMYNYTGNQDNDSDFFFPAFLGDWEADINSIIDIV